MEILDRSNTSIQFQIGGDSRDRTGDLLLARQALSQLSYIPVLSSFVLVVGPSGLEPPTLRLSVVRSSQLSYGPLFSLVEISGIEPLTSCLQGRRSPS